MALHSPKDIAAVAIRAGIAKHNVSVIYLLVLGFMAGAYIATGFLLDLRVISKVPASWSALANFLGACVFPVGIILAAFTRAELITGNMMTLPVAWFAREISGLGVLRNWFWVTLANFLGSIAVAWFFGHLLGMTEGNNLTKTLNIADNKIHAGFLHSFISAISCNCLVCLAVWLSFASKDIVSKIVGLWFPVMAFVAIGFQQVVANMFIIPAAIFAGALRWSDFVPNFVAVFLGNAVGGVIFIALVWYFAFRPYMAAASRAN